MKSDIEIRPAVGPYGHIRWYDAPEIDDPRAALLGRLAALYSYGAKTRGLYDISVLQEPCKRSNLLRTVTAWAEVYPSRTIQRRLVTLCIASPGVNAVALEQEPFDMQALAWWYEWEQGRQDARELLTSTLAKLWPPIRADLAPLVALGVPSNSWNKIRKMEQLPSLDIERCLNEALNGVQNSFDLCDRPFFDDLSDLQRYYEQPEKKALQKAFTEAWKEEERRLLAIDPKARDKEYMEFGV